jgi:hypothetical protein
MATFTKLASGSWRAQVRRKARYVSETFLRREDARKWATEAERRAKVGRPLACRRNSAATQLDLRSPIAAASASTWAASAASSRTISLAVAGRRGGD